MHDDVIFYCGGRRHKVKQSSSRQEGPRTVPVYILLELACLECSHLVGYESMYCNCNCNTCEVVDHGTANWWEGVFCFLVHAGDTLVSAASETI